ncbi:hypothetical protein V5O48_019668, partial [Marasmius crinis-equi]
PSSELDLTTAGAIQPPQDVNMGESKGGTEPAGGAGGPSSGLDLTTAGTTRPPQDVNMGDSVEGVEQAGGGAGDPSSELDLTTAEATRPPPADDVDTGNSSGEGGAAKMGSMATPQDVDMEESGGGVDPAEGRAVGPELEMMTAGVAEAGGGDTVTGLAVQP